MNFSPSRLVSSRVIYSAHLLAALLLVSPASWSAENDKAPQAQIKASPSSENAVDFMLDVLPVLELRCMTCHSAKRQKGDLRLDSSKLILAGGEHGPAVVPGQPDKSLLLQRIGLPDDDDYLMPADHSKKGRLTPAQEALIRQWIAAGSSFGAWDAGSPSSNAVSMSASTGVSANLKVKGYLIPVPEGWSAATPERLKTYNDGLAWMGIKSAMDGKLIQHGSSLFWLPSIDICILPRSISEAELAAMPKFKNELERSVDDEAWWLNQLKIEESRYDAAAGRLYNHTSSVGANGIKMAYSGVTIFRDGKQIEMHGNSLHSDRAKMAALVNKIADGVKAAP